MVTEELVLLSKLADGSSCGMMVNAQVYTYLRNTFRFQQHMVDAVYVCMLRLRLLRILLTNSETKHPAIDGAVHVKLVEHFHCGNEQRSHYLVAVFCHILLLSNPSSSAALAAVVAAVVFVACALADPLRHAHVELLMTLSAVEKWRTSGKVVPRSHENHKVAVLQIRVSRTCSTKRLKSQAPYQESRTQAVNFTNKSCNIPK
ncbi:hypothetical protein PybrP1_010625 [[Pythium] brassicae (nom. inval.)]|nr:hypothetical protein PybrP1_010625 [[Pythium] brassicae (nom. inval.)]